jgi:hypothetical protein
VASVAPVRSFGESIPSRTTRAAPPEVVPEMMRSARPSDWTKPLIDGLGPTKLASIPPENSASITSVPELNVRNSISTSGPSALANRSCSTPTIAGAWVRFGR